MSLPLEILVNIFKFVPTNELLNIKLTSKWYNEVVSNNLWYINRTFYQSNLEKKTLSILKSEKMTIDHMSDLIVTKRFELKHTDLLMWSLQNCPDRVNKLQLDNIKEMYRIIVSGESYTLFPRNIYFLNNLAQMCAAFLIKMNVNANFLLSLTNTFLGIELLEFILNRAICNCAYPDRKELLEHYLRKRVIFDERNYSTVKFLNHCLRRLAVTQQSEKCLELMNLIVMHLNHDMDQRAFIMNEVLFMGVWRKKRKVIDFAMEYGAQYDFNENIITRLLGPANMVEAGNQALN